MKTWIESFAVLAIIGLVAWAFKVDFAQLVACNALFYAIDASNNIPRKPVRLDADKRNRGD